MPSSTKNSHDPDLIDLIEVQTILELKSQRFIYRTVSKEVLPPPTNFQKPSRRCWPRLWNRHEIKEIAEARRKLKLQD